MANKTAPLLIIEKGFSDASVVVLDETPHVLGKIATAGTSFDNPYVSRRHAEIEQVGERYRIRDLGSKNGTFVNGEAVSTGGSLAAQRRSNRTGIGTNCPDFPQFRSDYNPASTFPTSQRRQGDRC